MSNHILQVMGLYFWCHLNPTELKPSYVTGIFNFSSSPLFMKSVDQTVYADNEDPVQVCNKNKACKMC